MYPIDACISSVFHVLLLYASLLSGSCIIDKYNVFTRVIYHIDIYRIRLACASAMRVSLVGVMYYGELSYICTGDVSYRHISYPSFMRCTSLLYEWCIMEKYNICARVMYPIDTYRIRLACAAAMRISLVGVMHHLDLYCMCTGDQSLFKGVLYYFDIYYCRLVGVAALSLFRWCNSFVLSLSFSLMFSFCLSLCLTHTHTHTHSLAHIHSHLVLLCYCTYPSLSIALFGSDPLVLSLAHFRSCSRSRSRSRSRRCSRFLLSLSLSARMYIFLAWIHTEVGRPACVYASVPSSLLTIYVMLTHTHTHTRNAHTHTHTHTHTRTSIVCFPRWTLIVTNVPGRSEGVCMCVCVCMCVFWNRSCNVKCMCTH